MALCTHQRREIRRGLLRELVKFLAPVASLADPWSWTTTAGHLGLLGCGHHFTDVAGMRRPERTTLPWTTWSTWWKGSGLADPGALLCKLIKYRRASHKSEQRLLYVVADLGDPDFGYTYIIFIYNMCSTRECLISVGLDDPDVFITINKMIQPTHVGPLPFQLLQSCVGLHCLLHKQMDPVPPRSHLPPYHR